MGVPPRTGTPGGLGAPPKAAGQVETPVILQYAAYLGMDTALDTDLLWIAQQALTAELPAGWTEHADPMSGDAYFHNANTGETVWEHPCDSYYRNLYVQLKREKERHTEAEVSHLGYSPAEINFTVGTQATQPGAGGNVSNNRYLAPIARAEESTREKEARRRDRDQRKAERSAKTEVKRHKRWERSAWKIQRTWRVHVFRARLADWMRQKRAATLLQARIRGKIYRRRLREALVLQVRAAAATRLQAATRGGLTRLHVHRMRRIKAAGKRAREGDTRAIPLAVRVGHAAYIGRVGVRPSRREKGGEDGTSREDGAEYALSETNYERAHAALQVQTRVRGFLGRRCVFVGSIKAAKLK